MVWKTFRQLAQNGNSYTVALPALVRARLRLLKGDWIEMLFDESAETITIKAVDRREIELAPPVRRIGMTLVAK